MAAASPQKAAAGSPLQPVAAAAPQQQQQQQQQQQHHHHHHHHHKASWYSEYLFLGSILSGIYIFFLMFGYYQEKIYSSRHPETGERFSYSCFLVLSACVSNTVFAFLLLLLQHRRRALQLLLQLSSSSIREIFLISLSYSGSMLFTNYALTHVNYPTQILVKSAKMVPVVVGGFVFFGKTYPWQDYLSVVVVTCSLAAFQLCKSEGKAAAAAAAAAAAGENSLLGLLLLCGSLLCDGLTGPRQDRLVAADKNINSILLMLVTNGFAAAVVAAAAAAAEGAAPLLFLQQQQEAAAHLFAFCVCGSLGQLFIYQSLTHFGCLYTSLFTTIRKAASTVFSVYVFNHKLNAIQWTAFAAMFAAVLLQSYVTKRSKLRHQRRKKEA
ncbi:UDP-galactose transporter protein, putative [Eimeria necatrix]|uniref:UDP-galactose transporter protein, putative n=1 Tax=Eimeria necatrix TaxID=51315 RepID=U6MV28_9EIME|nr:UDP-galactose transporter protein, putative [Eimeria necatrix]CDJ66324.1 UDP-galactose transporter protein, putative [Eimeria necatrix]